MKTVTYKLPAHWASALINGDYSGLSGDEVQTVRNWEDFAGACLTCTDEPFFTAYHDAAPDVLACDCLEYTFPAKTCPHCGRDLEEQHEIASGLCSSDDCPRHDANEVNA